MNKATTFLAIICILLDARERAQKSNKFDFDATLRTQRDAVLWTVNIFNINLIWRVEARRSASTHFDAPHALVANGALVYSAAVPCGQNRETAATMTVHSLFTDGPRATTRVSRLRRVSLAWNSVCTRPIGLCIHSSIAFRRRRQRKHSYTDWTSTDDWNADLLWRHRTIKITILEWNMTAACRQSIYCLDRH